MRCLKEATLKLVGRREIEREARARACKVAVDVTVTHGSFAPFIDIDDGFLQDWGDAICCNEPRDASFLRTAPDDSEVFHSEQCNGVGPPLPSQTCEIELMSSFPTSFRIEGSFIEKWARIGNSVLPLFTKALAESIRQELLSWNTV